MLECRKTFSAAGLNVLNDGNLHYAIDYCQQRKKYCGILSAFVKIIPELLN